MADEGGMFLAAGGAGFFGSNLVANFEEAGATKVVVNDSLGNDAKRRKPAKRQIADFVPSAGVMAWLRGRELEAVIHIGARSTTKRQPRDGGQFPPVAAPALLEHGIPHSVHLRLLDGDLWL